MRRRQNEQKDVDNVGQMTSIPTSTHSSISKSLFTNGTIEVDLLDHQRADAKLIPGHLLKKLRKKQLEVNENYLSHTEYTETA